jgi:hypothetical protein
MDIVKRLRRWSAEESTYELLSDAADEIERLRDVLFKLDQAAKDSYGSPAYGSMASSFVQSIVTKALREKE